MWEHGPHASFVCVCVCGGEGGRGLSKVNGKMECLDMDRTEQRSSQGNTAKPATEKSANTPVFFGWRLSHSLPFLISLLQPPPSPLFNAHFSIFPLAGDSHHRKLPPTLHTRRKMINQCCDHRHLLWQCKTDRLDYKIPITQSKWSAKEIKIAAKQVSFQRTFNSLFIYEFFDHVVQIAKKKTIAHLFIFV